MCSPPVVAGWSGAPDIVNIEGLSLDGAGEEADDEDNIAYKQLVVSGHPLLPSLWGSDRHEW